MLSCSTWQLLFYPATCDTAAGYGTEGWSDGWMLSGGTIQALYEAAQTGQVGAQTRWAVREVPSRKTSCWTSKGWVTELFVPVELTL